MLKTKYPKRGQILVITLIIMFILSLIALSAAVGINRDTQQRVYNEVYDQNYFSAESRILEASSAMKSLGGIDLNNINQLGAKFHKLSNISTNFSSGCNEISIGKFECIVQEECDRSDILISQNKGIKGLPLTSSDAIHINLRNLDGVAYAGLLNFSWTGNVQWSLSLVYKDTFTNVITGLNELEYDNIKGQYSSASSNGSGFNFVNSSSTKFTLANLDSLIPVSYRNVTCIGSTCEGYPFFLRLRPIIIDGAPSTAVTLTADTNLPVQSAEITSQTKNTCVGNTSPTPLLSLNVPLVDAPPALFDYVYYEK